MPRAASFPGISHSKQGSSPWRIWAIPSRANPFRCLNLIGSRRRINQTPDFAERDFPVVRRSNIVNETNRNITESINWDLPSGIG
jgi:hypothetical protein